jgi:hypothetical protein
MAWLCEGLGVSRGGCYAWLTRPQRQRARRDEALGIKTGRVFCIVTGPTAREESESAGRG